MVFLLSFSYLRLRGLGKRGSENLTDSAPQSDKPDILGAINYLRPKIN